MPLAKRIHAALLTSAALAAVLPAAPAAGHHGDTGDYDRTHPVYVSGDVTTARYGFPHATLELSVPAGLTPPTDQARFDRLDEMDGRPTLSRLVAAPAGPFTILFPPDLTSQLNNASDRPEAGQRVEAVAYPRCQQGNQYDGEHRVQAFATTDGEVLFRNASTLTRYVDGCAAADADHGSSGRPVMWAVVGIMGVLVVGVPALLILRRRRARA